ncbi:MAG TPA: HTTM domain-containing protein [Polyangiaceae bacterium]|nr:HTTM domain-containing protein [Polyangiaceae bacterium]
MQRALPSFTSGVLPHAWLARTSRPIDGAWLAAFRFLFGILLAVSVFRFLAFGWVERLLVEPSFHFKYWGFEWVEPLPGPAMRGLFWLLLVAALTTAVGFCFRLSAAFLGSGFVYFQLVDVSNYLNHYYLAALLVWLLCVSPAHRTWSVDAWLARRRAARGGPEPARFVARGWLYLFRFQIGLVYTFAGLAKAQSDWLLHGQPLSIWLGASTDLPVLGPLFAVPGVPLLMSWCGFLFDTTIVLWLLWRRTRPYAFAVVVLFHALTGLLLPIGMFPLIMITAAMVFFEPDWPRRFLARFRLHTATVEPLVAIGSRPLTRGARFALGLGLVYCGLQLALPLRFLAYPGNVLWHEQGMRFSWRVMVRAKGGNTNFIVRNKATGEAWHVSPRAYLTGLQETEMSSQPDLILQLAHHIQRDFEARGRGPVEVRVDSRVAFNGRRSAPLIDPSRDLATIRDGLAARDWVLPAPDARPTPTRPVL